MNKNFSWEVVEDRDVLTDGRFGQNSPNGRGVWFWGVILIAALIVMTGLYSLQKKVRDKATSLQTDAQTVLDLEREAFLQGDGDLFFSLQSRDPAWFAAQMLPANQAAYRAGITVTSAEPHEEFVRANVSWSDSAGTWQKIMFFQQQNGALRHVPSDPDFWGKQLTRRPPWGQFLYPQADEEWAASIIEYVREVVLETCDTNLCVKGRVPLTVEMRSDYRETAVPDTLTIPSPRLIAINSKGQPAPEFWRELRTRLEAHLKPSVIRFAVPPSSGKHRQVLFDYRRAAAKFTATRPDIIIEIVELPVGEHDLASLAAEYDGVAILPTAELLASGLVHHLSDYVETDPNFDEADFYEQIWRGNRWQEHQWFMPQAASMRILYFDKAAYRNAEKTEPSLRWTWDEMAQDVATLLADQPDVGNFTGGFLDLNLDSLYSYAYNWNNTCPESVTVNCQNPLRTANVAAALDWYGQMAATPGQMPNLERVLAGDSEATLISFQTGRRRAIVWADLPTSFEYQFAIATLGAVPFPGSDRFDGISPLWLQGSFISQQSERPLAVWHWLNYLSYQTPIPRLVPARASVANKGNYWGNMPPALGDTMRTAFPFARAVTVEEWEAITWKQVTAVIQGDATPEEAAQDRPELVWFNKR